MNVSCKEESVEVLDQGSSTSAELSMDGIHADLIDESPTMTIKGFPRPVHEIRTCVQVTSPLSPSLLREECHNCISNDDHCNTHSETRRHRRTSTDDRPHFCMECNKNFKLISQLKIHERIHKNDRPYICEYCQKGFKQPSNLTQHRRIHTGERPYRCSYCEKTFKQKSQVMQHERLHTGSKPYVCKQCSRGFVQLSQLQSHEKTHRERAGRAAKKHRLEIAQTEILVTDDLVNQVLLS